MITTSAFLFSLPLLMPTQMGGGWEFHYQVDLPNHPSFGQCVANAGDVNGDGFDDMVIGAPDSDYANVVGAGTAFVYSGVDGTQLAWLEGPRMNERFGIAVVGMGDVNGDGLADVAIASASPRDQGNVRVLSSVDWSEIFILKGSSVSGVSYGAAIGSMPDINGDGVRELLVGDPDRRGVGDVFIYSGSNGDLLRQHVVWSQAMRFGSSFCNTGDWDQDGVDDYAIGAPLHLQPSSSKGAVLVYSTLTGDLLKRINAPFNIQGFGNDMDLIGDVNGDGFKDLVVGADTNNANLEGNAGAAVVVSGWTGSALHLWEGSERDQRLGYSVAGIGDIDWDGIPDVAVGSPSLNTTTPKAGRVHAYSGKSGKRHAVFQAKDVGSELGTGIANLGDFDWDGTAEFVVTEPGLNRILVASPSKYLAVDQTSLSASTGGILHFDIDFPPPPHLKEYKLLVSASGPGKFYLGTWIPLKYDPFVLQTWTGDYSPLTTLGAQGNLDPLGNATASLVVNADDLAQLVGRSLHFAVVSMRKNAHKADDSSAAIEVQILP